VVVERVEGVGRTERTERAVVRQDRKYGTGGGSPATLKPEPSWDQVLERNAIERMKREKPITAIVEEIPELAERHYLDISEEDVVRLKWYGLYHDKPKVGSYMLRIKIPGGVLSADGLEAIGRLSNEFGEGFAELSTRQNVQLHFIQLETVPLIFDRLARVGLTTAGACGDAVRNITGCPLAGVLREEAFDVRPVMQEAARFFYGHPVYMDLPRKQKFSIASCPYQCDMPEINCMSFIGVVRDGVEGFALRVGGGLSTVPRLARDLGVWVPVAEAMDVMRALLDIWREDRRYRLSRVKARFKFMVDDYGVAAIRSMVEERLGRRLDDGEAPAPKGFTAHVGAHEQKQDGLFHLGAPIPVGITSGDELISIAALARSVGGDVRLTKQQNLIVTGVPAGRLDESKDELARIGFPVDANPLRATAIACTGEPHCNYAVTETKSRMRDLLQHLERRWGDRLGSFRVNLDGCPHACALHWVGDIGLMGTTAREAIDGERQAYDLFLRGGVGLEQAVARPLVRRVPFPRVEETVDRLIGAWLDARDAAGGSAPNGARGSSGGGGETFRDFCIRTPDEELLAIAAGSPPSDGPAGPEEGDTA
jgi:ferredoxin-nitrite reductase